MDSFRSDAVPRERHCLIPSTSLQGPLCALRLDRGKQHHVLNISQHSSLHLDDSAPCSRGQSRTSSRSDASSSTYSVSQAASPSSRAVFSSPSNSPRPRTRPSPPTSPAAVPSRTHRDSYKLKSYALTCHSRLELNSRVVFFGYQRVHDSRPRSTSRRVPLDCPRSLPHPIPTDG